MRETYGRAWFAALVDGGGIASIRVYTRRGRLIREVPFVGFPCTIELTPGRPRKWQWVGRVDLVDKRGTARTFVTADPDEPAKFVTLHEPIIEWADGT